MIQNDFQHIVVPYDNGSFFGGVGESAGLDKELQGKVIVMMLTTMGNPADR